MHQQLCHEFHHPQWRLTANRRSRYRAMIKEWGDRPDFLILWGILLRAIWSDPWRREARSHHDPTNILRSFEQREGWWEVAEAELEAGRDGGTYHQLTHAPRPSEQAAIERQREASLSRARTKVAKLESELDAQAQDDNQQMAAWWKARSLAEQRELMAKAGEMMRELWPFDTKPTEGINRAVYMKLWREAQERQPADLQLTP